MNVLEILCGLVDCSFGALKCHAFYFTLFSHLFYFCGITFFPFFIYFLIFIFFVVFVYLFISISWQKFSKDFL